ncbi:hypothetical protein [Calycomorphotria hydatis]|uniref:Uncharacterized protein n=1 Tax=Calycomorphotria hydatis TaxID=2528027 RepID=A0A517T3T1_9PLAN|nr:hypothetical protein [Calycomorphotria hydatis]QDT63037.1 hypothetical protein V22_02360 [Calycomorphotria hydatis]
MPEPQPPAAFCELDWSRPDVWGILAGRGILTVTEDKASSIREWLTREKFNSYRFDCNESLIRAAHQLCTYLKWNDQFGYILSEDQLVNLNALNDGFEFELSTEQGFYLELVGIEAEWNKYEGWLRGLLTICSNYSINELAQGRKFLTLIQLGRESPLIGEVFDDLAIPVPIDSWPNSYL